jgi:hypothetical protein
VPFNFLLLPYSVSLTPIKTQGFKIMDQTLSSPKFSTNKELIISLFNAIDSSNWTLLRTYFAQNIIYERPGYQALIGLDQVINFYHYERIIASGKHHIEHIVIEENYGSCWGQFIGLHKNGSPLNERFADIYSFEYSQIKTRQSYFFRAAI